MNDPINNLIRETEAFAQVAGVALEESKDLNQDLAAAILALVDDEERMPDSVKLDLRDTAARQEMIVEAYNRSGAQLEKLKKAIEVARNTHG